MQQSSTSVLQTRLADLVRNDPRTAPVLDRFGLDYCCHGHRTLQEASIDDHVAVSEVLDELLALGAGPETGTTPASSTDLATLVRHIINTHHAYVREHQPILAGWLEKLVDRHGARHPELLEVRGLFERLSSDLLQHMSKEENILFPFIDALAGAAATGHRAPLNPFGTVLNPIRAMEQEHVDAGNLLFRIRSLTGGYRPPSDACTTYRVCYDGLARFEADLHQHVHLENYVLFPRAIALEGLLG